MSHVLTRITDGLLSWFVPAMHARAGNCRTGYQFCYCEKGFRYARPCMVCDGKVVSCALCGTLTGVC